MASVDSETAGKAPFVISILSLFFFFLSLYFLPCVFFFFGLKTVTGKKCFCPTLRTLSEVR